MKSLKLIVLLILLTYSVTMLPGCYGSFTLTKKVYVWNGSMGDKWINTLVYWALFIIPV